MAMRNKMPICAAIVDDLREVFGVDEMNQVIRAGLKGDCKPERRVYFCEAGQSLGRQWLPDPAKVLAVSQMVVVKPKPVEKGRR